MIKREMEVTYKNGELTVSTAATGTDAYVGGSPLAVNTSGELELCKSGANFVGIAARSSYEDMQMTGARGVGTYYGVPCLLRLGTFSATKWSSHQTPTAFSGEGYPYLTTDNWVAGDPLYIDSDGKWTRSNPGSQSSFGIVREVGTSNTYLDVQFYGGHEE